MNKGFSVRYSNFFLKILITLGTVLISISLCVTD